MIKYLKGLLEYLNLFRSQLFLSLLIFFGQWDGVVLQIRITVHLTLRFNPDNFGGEIGDLLLTHLKQVLHCLFDYN